MALRVAAGSHQRRAQRLRQLEARAHLRQPRGGGVHVGQPGQRLLGALRGFGQLTPGQVHHGQVPQQLDLDVGQVGALRPRQGLQHQLGHRVQLALLEQDGGRHQRSRGTLAVVVGQGQQGVAVGCKSDPAGALAGCLRRGKVGVERAAPVARLAQDQGCLLVQARGFGAL